MENQELNLTPEELQTYFRLEREIESYNDAILAMTELIHTGLFDETLDRQVLVELKSRCRKKEIEFETLQAK